MIEAAIPTLALIAGAAVLGPIIAEQTRGLRVPSVVIELLLGILIGPYVLKLAHPDGLIESLSDMGLTYLMFLAGYELELDRIKGPPLRLALLGWLISLGLALGLAFVLVSSGLALDTLVVGLALTTTALGTLLPIIVDAGVLPTRFGAYLVGIGTAGEFGPIVVVGLLLTRKDPVLTTLLLVAFVVVAVAAALFAARTHPPKVVAMLRRHLHSSAQLPVRMSMLIVLLLVYLAFELGLDVLLGAFAAGIVVRLFTIGDQSEVIKSKLDAIGFGFLIPIFFIVSGIHFDLHILLTRPSALLRLAAFLAMMPGRPGDPRPPPLYDDPPGATHRAGPVLRYGSAAHRGDHLDRHGRGPDAARERRRAGRGRHVVGAAVPGYWAAAPAGDSQCGLRRRERAGNTVGLQGGRASGWSAPVLPGGSVTWPPLSTTQSIRPREITRVSSLGRLRCFPRFSTTSFGQH